MDTKHTILIINSKPDVLKLQSKMIDEKENQLFTATSPDDALKRMEQYKPDIVLLEMVGNGKSAFEFCRQIKSRPGQARALILFVPGTGLSEDDKKTAFEAGGDGILAWPFSAVDLAFQLRLSRESCHARKGLKFKSCFNNLPYAFFVIDVQGNFIELNEPAIEIAGYAKDELLNKNYIELVIGEHRQKADELFRKLKMDGKIKSEIGLLNKEGETRHVSVSAMKMADNHFLAFASDITDYKQSQIELRKSEEKFRKAFETSPDSINITRVHDGLFISINQGFTNLTGYTWPEVEGKTFADINIWKDPEDRKKLVQELQKNGTFVNMEARFVGKDGSILHGLMSASVIELKGENHILSVTHDITERYNLEQKLKLSEEKFRTIFNTITDSIFIHKLDGTIFEVNDTVFKRYGYTRDQVLKLEPSDIDTHEESKNISDRINKVIQNGTHTFETVHRNSEDKLMPVEVRSSIIHFLGEPAILSVVRDITSRKRAQIELFKVQLKLEENLKYFENLDEISKLLNRSFGNEEIIQAVIVEVARMFRCDRSWLLYPCQPDAEKHFVRYYFDKGLQPDKATGNMEIDLDNYSRNLMKLADEGKEPVPAYLDDLEATDSETTKNNNIKARLVVKVETKIGKPWLLGLHQTTQMHQWTENEFRLLKEIAQRLAQTLDNIELYKNLQQSEKKVREYSTNLETRVRLRTEELELQTKKIAESQQALTYLLEDMNEARKGLIFANEELDALNQELESFSYSVSHDLRAPLIRLDGFSRALIDHLKGTADDTTLHYLDRIRLSSQHMGELIKDILSLSRINRKELQVRNLDASEMADAIINEIIEGSSERKSKITVEEEIWVNADKTLLEFMMRNLIENAWKFTRKKEFTEITIGSELKDGKTVVYIRDNGIGFNMKYYDQLFAVFRRLHSDQEFPGTGVGLASVQRIVNRHKGEIWAEGEEGKGATFYFSL